MRILQVCPYAVDRPGGVQHHVLSLGEELRRRGHAALTIAPGPSPAIPRKHVLYAGTHKMISLLGTRFEISWVSSTDLGKLRRRIESWRPDLVHCHGIWVPFLPLQVLRTIRTATVASFHDTPPDTAAGRLLSCLFRLISKGLLDWLDGAIAVSSAPLAHLRAGMGSSRPIVVPPAIDLFPFFAVERDHGRISGEFSVLFIGRLEPRKGINVLLEAWRIIEQRPIPPGSKRVNLTVAGAGALEGCVRNAQNTGTGSGLVFKLAPSDDELKRLLTSADLVVVPSPSGESFGVVILEAMAAGVPVIAADNRGFRTVLTGEGRQSLVRAGDAQALARAILDSANDADRLKERADWGRKHVEQFDIRKVVVPIEAVYASAIQRFKVRQESRKRAK